LSREPSASEATEIRAAAIFFETCRALPSLIALRSIPRYTRFAAQASLLQRLRDTFWLSLAGKLLQVRQVPPPGGNLYTVRKFTADPD